MTDPKALTDLVRATVARDPKLTLVEVNGSPLVRSADYDGYQVCIEYPVGGKVYQGYAFLAHDASSEYLTQALDSLVRAAQEQMLVGDPFGGGDTLAGVST